MKRMLLFLLSTVWLFGATASEYYVKTLKAYLSSKSFPIVGAVYRYDFDADGVYAYNDWVFMNLTDGKIYRFLGTTPTEANAFGYVEVCDVDLNGKNPEGYFAYVDFPLDLDKRYSWIYLSLQNGCVYKLMGKTEQNLFDYLDFGNGYCDPDLTFEIENNQVCIVYRSGTTLNGVVDHVDTAGYSWSLVRNDDQLLVADGLNGMVAIDLLGRGSMEQAYAIDPGGMVYNIAVDPTNRIAYLAAGERGVDVIDLERRILLANYSCCGRSVNKVLLSPDGRQLYCLSDNKEIYSFDVAGSTLSGFRLVGSFVGAGDMLFCGTDLLVADSAEGLVRIDLSDATNPQKTLLLRTGDLRNLATYEGRYVLATDWSGSKLVIYDTTTGQSQIVRESWPIEKVVPAEGKIYILHKIAIATVWDMNDPMAPNHINTIYLPYPAHDLYIDENESVGYFTDGGYGVISMMLY